MTGTDGPSGGATEQACEFVHGTTFDDLPADVVDHARRMLMDTVGVAVAARETPVARSVEAVSNTLTDGATSGEVRIPGTPLGGSVEEVARLLGTMAHALDFDDVHHEMGGHPSSPILSAVLPVSERHRVSGADLLAAFVVGVEVEVALAKALNPGHYERGWHPTAIVGTIGAALAAGKVLELDVDDLRTAVGIAGSQAAGIKGNFGTMTKPYHVGALGRNAVEAARLAAAGMTANRSVLELEFGGFCDLFRGESPIEVERHFGSLGSTWALVDPPVAFKPYPCCGSTHSAIDAALALRRDHDLDPTRIRSIEIREHPRRLGHTDRPAPETALDAKFSVQYVVSVALRDGDVWLDDFTDTSADRPEIRSLMRSVDVRSDETAFESNEWGATVRVETADGRSYERTEPAPLGSADDPMTDEQLERKYRRCTGESLSRSAVDDSLALIEDIERLDDVSRLIDSLTTAP